MGQKMSNPWIQTYFGTQSKKNKNKSIPRRTIIQLWITKDGNFQSQNQNDILMICTTITHSFSNNIG